MKLRCLCGCWHIAKQLLVCSGQLPGNCVIKSTNFCTRRYWNTFLFFFTCLSLLSTDEWIIKHLWLSILFRCYMPIYNRYACDWLQWSSLHSLHRMLTQIHMVAFESCIYQQIHQWIPNISAIRSFKTFPFVLYLYKRSAKSEAMIILFSSGSQRRRSLSLPVLTLIFPALLPCLVRDSLCTALQTKILWINRSLNAIDTIETWVSGNLTALTERSQPAIRWTRGRGGESCVLRIFPWKTLISTYSEPW